MKSSSLGTILGLVSLLGVGALYFKIDRLEERIVPTEHGRAAVARVAPDDEVTLVSRSVPPTAELEDSSDIGSDEDSPARTDLGRGTVEQRIARLERIERDRPDAVLPIPAPGSSARIARMPNFARSVDHLSNTLKLTPTQTDRVRESVDRAKRRIEDVLKIPDESGVSPYEQRREKRKKMEAALKSGNPSGIISFAMDSQEYRSRTIPGRDTTYGAEVDRIKKESRDEIAGSLDYDQQEEFKDLRTDSLYGESGTTMTSVFIAGGTADEDDSGER